MFENILKEQYPFAVRFFESALSVGSNKLANAFLLTGSDSTAQYMLALNVAKNLNCQTPEKAEFCDCTSCLWLTQNRHPAVITISPVDYIHMKKGTSKTVISVEQARFLKNELQISSQYHRVIIFTDAKEGPDWAKEAETAYKNLKIPFPQNEFDEGERIWVPYPLQYDVFNDNTSNTLLKTIEEPGDKITFFFLTRDKQDIISTIASRCQCINVSSTSLKSINTDALSDFLKNWPPKNIKEAVCMAEFLAEKSQKEDYKPQELIAIIQEYFKELMRLNADNKNLVLKLTKSIKQAETAKQQIEDYVNLNSALETMFLSMI
jgi:DNA polymerase III gamma/tau subunit